MYAHRVMYPCTCGNALQNTMGSRQWKSDNIASRLRLHVGRDVGGAFLQVKT